MGCSCLQNQNFDKSKQIEDINNIDNQGEFGRSTNNNEILQLFSDNKLIKVEKKLNTNKNENEERYDIKSNQSKEVKIEVKKEYSNKSQGKIQLFLKSQKNNESKEHSNKSNKSREKKQKHIKKQKKENKNYSSKSQEKMQKILTIQNISENKKHKEHHSKSQVKIQKILEIQNTNENDENEEHSNSHKKNNYKPILSFLEKREKERKKKSIKFG